MCVCLRRGCCHVMARHPVWCSQVITTTTQRQITTAPNTGIMTAAPTPVPMGSTTVTQSGTTSNVQMMPLVGVSILTAHVVTCSLAWSAYALTASKHRLLASSRDIMCMFAQQETQLIQMTPGKAGKAKKPSRKQRDEPSGLEYSMRYAHLWSRQSMGALPNDEDPAFTEMVCTRVNALQLRVLCRELISPPVDPMRSIVFSAAKSHSLMYDSGGQYQDGQASCRHHADHCTGDGLQRSPLY